MTDDLTALFEFTALHADGGTSRGEVTAASEDAARQIVAARGLLPISLRGGRGGALDRPELPPAELALGLRVLADLLQAGLPMTRALGALPELVPVSWHVLLPHLNEAVRQGRGLAAALESAPVRFPPLLIGVIRAGEAGSGAAAAVGRAAAFAQRAADTRGAILGALAYPAVVAVAGVLSVGMMIGIVLPRFAVILADIGQTLPPSTRAVLATGALIRLASVPVAVLAAVAYAALRAYSRTERGRVAVHGRLLRLPGIGAIRCAAATANATAALGGLLASGVPIRAALASAATACGDAEVGRRLGAVRDSVITGQSLASAVRDHGALTATAARLIGAGEESGRLPAMLDHAAQLEGDWAQARVRTAVRLLEPALILAFAGVVGIVAAALLQAVYSVRPA